MTNDIKISRKLAERWQKTALQWGIDSIGVEIMHALAAPVVERQESDLEIAARLVEGKTVSVDVSTGDDDAGNRLFCTIVEVMEDGDSFTLLAVDPEPNFETSPPAPVAVSHPFADKVIRKLQRFHECMDDGQGADIGRHWFDLLTQLGLLNRVQRSPALWEITQQGEDCLDKVKELNQ